MAPHIVIVGAAPSASQSGGSAGSEGQSAGGVDSGGAKPERSYLHRHIIGH
jgi:hypothetical protein